MDAFVHLIIVIIIILPLTLAHHYAIMTMSSFACAGVDITYLISASDIAPVISAKGSEPVLGAKEPSIRRRASNFSAWVGLSFCMSGA